MSAFDKVIGYESVKREFLQVIDVIKNKEVYKNLGAKMPHGILLSGEPGVGKTLIANCFIEECGLPAFILRRAKGADNFIDEIADTFKKARGAAPSVIVLDDMDKFANEDDNHRDAEEYVAVQAAIDDVKDFEVFVIATVNDPSKLPRSLTRSGRFDRFLEIETPDFKDADAIIRHYMKDKKVSANLNFDDVSKMISYSSCAQLETILNEAALGAAYARKSCMDIEDITEAVLKMRYRAQDNCTELSDEEQRQTAMHEAGHLVVCEALIEGSVGLASIRKCHAGGIGGFIHRCKELSRRPQHILVSLAGKAAVELYYSHSCASGCASDIERAYDLIRDGMSDNGTHGFGLIDGEHYHSSESMISKAESVTQAELERYMFKARDILLKNRDFLEKATEALLEKKTLLASDIRAIRENCTVVPAVI